jgi:hypothetical protein
MLDNYNKIKITPEQKKITKDISNGHVQVIAVAGCGKTTTNLFIALENMNKNILLLTYNTSLKMETKHKISLMDIKNMEVHTYHSFAYNHYKKCLNDYGLYDICKNNMPCSKKFYYDIIILDEMQDMTYLYFEFVCKIYLDNGNKDLHFCILGDPHQTIYQYNGSDTRYFLDFPNYFNNLEWTKVVLNQTFRCTNQIADFLNKTMLKDEKRIVTNKINQQVRYIICDSYSDRIYKEIQYYLKMGYKYSDIFILAPSVKSQNSPVRELSNLCSENDIPVFVSYTDEEKPNEKVLTNKLVFLTFHQSKGLERKVVIIMGFDNSYFLFFKKNYNQNICPNELYVAVTRSSERLSVIHDFHFDFCPFLDQNTLLTYSYFESFKMKIRIYDDYKTNKSIKSVTNITKHLSFIDMHKLIDLCEIKVIHQSSRHIDITNLVLQNISGNLDSANEIFENVSDINSLCIMSIFEYLKTGKMSNLPNINLNPDTNLIKNCQDELYLSHFLQRCNENICCSNRYFFKLYQISNYNWMKPKLLLKCLERLDFLNISRNSKFEHDIKFELENFQHFDLIKPVNALFTGRIDCIDFDNQIIWEFKCVNNLDYEHIIQVAIYQYLMNKIQSSMDFKYYLYNVLDNNLLHISINNFENFENVFLNILFNEKNKKTLTDYCPEKIKNFVNKIFINLPNQKNL